MERRATQTHWATYKNGKFLSEILYRIKNDYVDEKTDKELHQAAAKGLLSSLDPHSGYLNIDDAGDIISIQNNDGSPDSQVQKSNVLEFESKDLEFKEYAFSIDQLPAFRNYRIKLVVTSTSQVYVPRIKDLRCIAIA